MQTLRVRWVTATHKLSGLFIDLPGHLSRMSCYAKRIHVIVDNCRIRSSRQATLALTSLPRVKLHFLPPYSPEFNPIEHVWLDLHADVTRNHRRTTINERLVEVRILSAALRCSGWGPLHICEWHS